jgi:hypothetical protein
VGDRSHGSGLARALVLGALAAALVACDASPQGTSAPSLTVPTATTSGTPASPAPPLPSTAGTPVTAPGVATSAGPGTTASPRPAEAPPSGLAQVTVCATLLCADSAPWRLYGATIYHPGNLPPEWGIVDPSGTVALARAAGLNAVRLTDFLSTTGDPSAAPFDAVPWARVDTMIAAAEKAGLHVALSLADYREMLWNSCVDPYTTNWSRYLTYVGDRVNTVTGRVYKDDPTIAFVSIAGEPLQVGRHTFTAETTRRPCTITYTTHDLTAFYKSTTRQWKALGGSVLVDSGGLGYLDLADSGIDWRSIFSLPTNAFCAIKTYGGMQAWAHNARAYCAAIRKPIIDEEFGWDQSAGDSRRAAQFQAQYAQLRGMGFAGVAFWNLGYERATSSYDVSPATPLTFEAVEANAPHS